MSNLPLAIESNNYYTIVGSRQIQSYSLYKVAVNLHNASEPTTIKLTIKNGESFRQTKEVTVQPFSTENVGFEIGQLSPASEDGYMLIAEGVSGIIFRNETSLALNDKYFSTFIQTDKAIYKPGDKIQFRVIVVDENTIPMEINDLHIYIKDGKSNRIKQWSGITLSNGVYSNELQLSDNPVLGDWSFVVNVLGENKTKVFEVAEYVLPKFEVTIDTLKDITFKDDKIRATVRAMYTYGKSVRGEATIAVSQQHYGEEFTVRKVIKLNGNAYVEIDMAELKLCNAYLPVIQIDAEVEEELTGLKLNATTLVHVRTTSYFIRNVDQVRAFSPQVPFNFRLKVGRYDGAPIPNTEKSIDIILSPINLPENSTDVITKTLLLDNAGFTSFAHVFPADSTGHNLTAKYLGSEEHICSLHPIEKMNDNVNQISIQLLTEKPIISKPLVIGISSNNHPYATYQIFGRGKLLLTATVSVPNEGWKEFEFTPTLQMYPLAKIIVYYLKDGEMISSFTEIHIALDPESEIELQTSVQQARPGEYIDLRIRAQPKSYVGLLAVDQSVLLLKSGNDLSQDDIKNELNSYHQNRNNELMVCCREGYYNPYTRDFSSVGAFILSNMKCLKKCAPKMKRKMMKKCYKKFVATDIIEMVSVRKNFPETWLWSDLNNFGSSGKVSLPQRVPDTITSWIITGFSLNIHTGLSLTNDPTKLTVFQPFFVSLNLPYSIKRGEIVEIPIVVFNYMKSAVGAEVILYNDEHAFEFIDMFNETITSKMELRRSVSVRVKDNDGSAVSFFIKPITVGPIAIKVTATSPLAGDGIERILSVEAEGVPQYVNKALFVDLREKSDIESDMYIEIPDTAVPDSKRIDISVIGDILGSTITNLDQLIRMPYGCGEQNMLNFVPNIVIINYLKNTNQLTEAIETKAIKYMVCGYQQELTYKHADGSFSAFGESDRNGSTWLTAFVARSFRQAADHIDIDEEVINSSLSWLASKQTFNGSFPEVGEVAHTDMQGGAGNGIALTAYTLIAFLENKSMILTYQNTIDKALGYIVKSVESLDDIYAMALAAYALELADHSAKSDILNTYDSKAIVSEGYKYWNKPIPASDSQNIWYSKPNSVNTEMSAYGLMTLLQTKPITDVIPIMKWLLSQRNEQGGFQSTQDTVLGIQALAMVSEKIAVVDNDLHISVSHGDKSETKVNVTQETSLIHQQCQIRPDTSHVKIKASGHGFCLFQLSYKYNIADNGVSPRFIIHPVVKPSANSDVLELSVCTSFIADNNANKSNMAVMEVDFPSGFIFDTNKLTDLMAYMHVKKIETKNGDTKVIIYFDQIDAKELCPTVIAIRTHKVDQLKPAAISVYDYYDTSRRASTFYNIEETSLI